MSIVSRLQAEEQRFLVHVHWFNKCILKETLPGRDSTLSFRYILYIVSDWVFLIAITDWTTNYYNVFVVTENLLMMALWVIQQSECSTKFWGGFHPKETLYWIVSWTQFTFSVEYYRHWCYFENLVPV